MLQWQYRAGAGAGAKIMDKGGAKKEPEPKINNFGSATLLKIVQIDLKWVICTLNVLLNMKNGRTADTNQTLAVHHIYLGAAELRT